MPLLVVQNFYRLKIENSLLTIERILPDKLEDLKSFINAPYEKEAFEEAKIIQSLISDFNIGKEIVKLK
ncbi:hypothetical protein [Borreliella americana]|uniref:hypothetical protein n=1 Tax=Borreliella americana TaxID=478807 RepID=UPI001E4DE09D|nr:hypothetical protein [Borreliella americana]MCD2332640.1 hypothetical protein [Borreliella americana]